MEVTTLLMADDASAAAGKLYIHGAGWDTVFVPSFPTTIARLALVLTLRIEYHEAQEDHKVVIDLVDEDEKPFGDIRAEGILRVGHGALQEAGQPTLASQVLRAEDLKVSRPGFYTFRVFVNDSLLPMGHLGFRVASVGS